MALIVTQSALANCNPRTDIVEQSNGSFTYSVECHMEFGKLKKNESIREEQVKHLNKSIELQDLALSKANQRIENWQTATYKVEDRLLKLEKSTDTMKWIYFGLGIVVTGAAVWGAGQLK